MEANCLICGQGHRIGGKGSRHGIVHIDCIEQANKPCPNCEALEQRLAGAIDLIKRMQKIAIKVWWPHKLHEQVERFLSGQPGNYVGVERDLLSDCLSAIEFANRNGGKYTVLEREVQATLEEETK